MLYVLLFVVMALGLIVASACRRLVVQRRTGTSAFAVMDDILKRRYELIPALVEIVKKHIPHEPGVLQPIMVARNAAVQAERRAAMKPTDAAAIQQLSGTERALAEALTRLFAMSKDHPELRTDASMRMLIDQLKTLQHDLTRSRRVFNDAMTTYNTLRTTFPANYFADALGFSEVPLLLVEAVPERQKVRNVA